MAVQDRTKLTVEQFDELIKLPENAHRSLEYVGGRVIEVVSNNLSSEIAAFMLIEIGVHVRARDLGRVTGADGGYIVAGERYIPDVAFISKERQSRPSREAYNPNSPDLAVEVLSPSNDAGDMRVKVVNYLRAGTTVWIVDYETKQVEVYSPDKPPKTLTINDILDGSDVLPGFTLALLQIFKWMGD
jgi:Uma2 family endonuclease